MIGRQTHAKVDLNAIRNNATSMINALPTDTSLCAVVKADAYGHGAVQVSRAALEAGANMLAVAMAEEAIPLRLCGIECPILVIGPSNVEQIRLGIELNLDMCVFSAQSLEDIEEAAARQGKIGRVHVKIDTGMSRIGIQEAHELRGFLNLVERCRHVEIAGAFTHFAQADDYGCDDVSLRQYEKFMDYADIIRAHGHKPVLHASNSAAAQNLIGCDLDMVRFGISLYGYPAGSGHPARQISLRPAMEIEAEISAVRTVSKGVPIGYGGTYVTRRVSRIATVQIGYGDGYNRLLSNCGKMIVHRDDKACAAPIVGRVCMDMTMIDVTDISGVVQGDTVIAMGQSGNVHCDAIDIAEQCNTISYEILCAYTARIPRTYLGQYSEDG